MQKYYFNKQINRRLFLASVFYAIATQKRSISQEINNVECEWCWLGAVTNNSITIKAKLNNKVISNKNYVRVWYSTVPELDVSNKKVNKIEATSFVEKIATFDLVDLLEDTVYYYVIIADGRRYPDRGMLQFKTIKVNQPYDFAIACSSCAGGSLSQYSSYGVSNNKVFDLIRQYKHKSENKRDSNLAMFVHMGDLHYRNDFPIVGLKENHLDDYRKNYDMVMSQSRQKKLYQNIPLAYIWDDHDYGLNDSDGSYKLKYVASQVYREIVPHYPLPESLDKKKNKGAIYQSFLIGRVRFVLTDSRFHQESITKNNLDKSLLGKEQKSWLLQQFLSAKKEQKNNKEALTIWVNSIPWIAKANDSKTDSWNKFEKERTEIANFIKEHEIDKLLMISGDAHMLAIDDGKEGSANNYATGGGGSFPIVQAASLDSKPSFKGGPYNGKKYIVESTVKSKNGAIPGKGQWGLLNFTDDGSKIEVKVELKRMEVTLIENTLTFG